jgi:hypothetical protein
VAGGGLGLSRIRNNHLFWKGYYRPAEVQALIGDASKAAKKLGWVPRTKLEEIIEEMVGADIKRARADPSRCLIYLSDSQIGHTRKPHIVTPIVRARSQGQGEE